MNQHEYLKPILAKEKLYVLYSTATRVPFAVCDPETQDDEFFLFTREEEAVSMQAEYTARGEQVKVQVLPRKNYVTFLPECLNYGVNLLVFCDGGRRYPVPVEDIVKRKDTSRLPANKQPLWNPALQLVLLYFLQELRKQPEARNREKLDELDEEASVNLLRSQFLLPVKSLNPQEKRMELLVLKLPDGSRVVPLFTDVAECNHFRKEQQLQITKMDFAQLAAMNLSDELKGFLINPAGCSMLMTRSMMQKLLDGGVLLR